MNVKNAKPDPIKLRILAIDYGEKRMGFALSDPSGILATSLPVFNYLMEKEAVDRITELVIQKDVTEIVVGLPIALSGEETVQTRLVREFAKSIQEVLSVPVNFFDERLTTVEAAKALRETGLSKKKRLKTLDSASATLLLQTYLDWKQHK